MREAGDLLRLPGRRIRVEDAVRAVRAALRGPADDDWDPPPWLLPHQRDAACRLAGALACYSGALLADAVGLGKTYTALAVATRYPRTAFVIPAALRPQWSGTARTCAVAGRLVTHEALSRGAAVPAADLVVVDEAHRFRNPATRRYDRLARGIHGAHVLLLSATPVVNRAEDLVHLLRLFLADAAFTPFGIPSLIAACTNPPRALLHAVLPLVVARTARAARVADQIPPVRSAGVRRLATVLPEMVTPVVTALSALACPPLGVEGRALIIRHLLLRLSSSQEALGESLRRHRRYLDAAVAAVRLGEPPARGALRRLVLDGADGQLSLLLTAGADSAADVRAFEAEADRIVALLNMVRAAGDDPKRRALIADLEARPRRKTIVFTAARATALGIARSLEWRYVGVATASGGCVASGRIALDELLARFAPRAQAAAPVPPAMRIDVLVATDLASEGLNLQDADAVVHYDLPWNPFRLAQRLGRIARLGSAHAQVQASWFRPPAIIDRRLGLLDTIHRKALLQLALPVPVTGVVGHATVTSSGLEQRESLAQRAEAVRSGHAVFRGTGGGCVLRWTGAGGSVREVVALDGQPARHLGAMLLAAVDSRSPLPQETRVAVRRLLATRRHQSNAGPAHSAWQPLARRILVLARKAGTRRDRRLLRALDAALSRLRTGLTVGAERDLSDALGGDACRPLELWLDRHPPRPWRRRGPVLEVLLAGDGTPTATAIDGSDASETGAGRGPNTANASPAGELSMFGISSVS